MAARKFFEKLAVWAGAWQAVKIGAYIAGLLVVGLLGEGGSRGYGHGLYFGAASAIVALILVRIFWPAIIGQLFLFSCCLTRFSRRHVCGQATFGIVSS